MDDSFRAILKDLYENSFVYIEVKDFDRVAGHLTEYSVAFSFDYTEDKKFVRIELT